jgi:hypothetical protein
MYVFHVKATAKSKKWLKAHKIDLNALSSALSILVSEIYPSIKVHHVQLTLQILFNREDSEYPFKSNKIKLCEKPYTENSSIKIKQKDIFDHFLHEFRHWMQAIIFKKGIRELRYTDEDVMFNTNAYYRNKLEVDARQFVRQYLTKFTKYYKIFAKITPQ